MKKYLTTLFIGFALFLIGIAYFYIETINFDIDSSLPSNFNLKKEVLEYEIDSDQTYRITNLGTNKNMKLFIDNSLSNEVKIVVDHFDMVAIESKYYTIDYNNNELVRIDLESKPIMNWNDIANLYDLGIVSLKNKTIYNYTLLKYPEIKVFVNENYRNNIEFVDNYGKAYAPIK